MGSEPCSDLSCFLTCSVIVILCSPADTLETNRSSGVCCSDVFCSGGYKNSKNVISAVRKRQQRNGARGLASPSSIYSPKKDKALGGDIVIDR